MASLSCVVDPLRMMAAQPMIGPNSVRANKKREDNCRGAEPFPEKRRRRKTMTK
jgi:hypothetical protein